MQQLFIINPAAGKTDASVVLVPQIQAAAARAGVDVQIEVTHSRGHARQLAEAAAASGEEVHIYAAGGDGTMNEVLQGAANHPNIAVGCIPCGSGNDYVRNFGTPADFLDMDAQLAAEAFPVDLLATPQGYGIDICAAGIDAQVANGIPKWRRIPLCGGTTAYTLSILEAVCSSFRHHLHIQADDRELDGVYMMLAICNARMYGGGYCAAPQRQPGRRPAGRGAAKAGAAPEAARPFGRLQKRRAPYAGRYSDRKVPPVLNVLPHIGHRHPGAGSKADDHHPGRRMFAPENAARRDGTAQRPYPFAAKTRIQRTCSAGHGRVSNV